MADVVSDVVAAFVSKERQEIETQVFAQACLDDWFPEDVVEVFVLHHAVAASLQDCCAGKGEEFAECLLDLRDDDMDCLRVVTVEIGLDSLTQEGMAFWREKR